jgi:hypothetical protein
MNCRRVDNDIQNCLTELTISPINNKIRNKWTRNSWLNSDKGIQVSPDATTMIGMGPCASLMTPICQQAGNESLVVIELLAR